MHIFPSILLLNYRLCAHKDIIKSWKHSGDYPRGDRDGNTSTSSFFVIHYNDEHISIMNIHELSIAAFKATAFH